MSFVDILGETDFDSNDLDSSGMDAATRKRLGVDTVRTPRKKSKKPQKAIRNKLPRSLSKFPKHKHMHEGYLLSDIVDMLSEARKRWFSTPGKRGKFDPVGIILGRFFNYVPELEKSIVETDKRPNGWTLRGSWPSSGKWVFDWEMEAWKERDGGVVVKTIMFGKSGPPWGEVYRTTVATVDRAVPKWARKYFYPAKAEMKRRAGFKVY